MVRTRFAPSPTGFLHIGGARTALYSWAFARQQGGTFILRVEDTDLERSTEASVQAILDGMAWLGLHYDEGPFYQMQRMPRYREVIRQLLDEGKAYYCYASKEELDELREAQRARGEKPRYDGRWRPENAQEKKPPSGVDPVVRFKNPLDGDVTFNDLVKGPITFSNTELDDLIIARPDGTPTYNFCVVVDDWDMNITHVIRGDDHVNNTPRQINILKALDATLPLYAHVPMILGADGERLSKRHGAVSVMQYKEEGYLPEALLNYLARLGWSHGDDEIFSMEQFIEWFDLAHISRSAAQFNPEKLNWLNQQYIKNADLQRLAIDVSPHLQALGVDVANGPPLIDAVAIFRERTPTLVELAKQVSVLYSSSEVPAQLRAQHVTPDVMPALKELAARYAGLDDWRAEELGAVFDTVLKAHGLKMPKLAIPLRVLVFGTTQTPSIHPLLSLAGKARVLAALEGLN
ncbi:MAG TPA: glutamate--tRNA ligase [Burkholderiales bacterium]|nr:glutamate--tRNA ligase [Burkholderiales bacterium]